MKGLLGAILFLAVRAGLPAAVPATPAAPTPSVLTWGGDAEGGAPFVEADPKDPASLRGFDVEVAAEIARGLGRAPRFVQVAFASIDASVARGDFDIGMSGVEDTPARRAMLAATIPYFEFREVLTVRSRDRDRFRTLEDLRGRRVGTLGATIAYDTLIAARARTGILPVSYDDDVHPYTDLAQGRLDAVLLDHIIAARASRRVSGLAIQPAEIATGRYVGVLARGNEALRDRVSEILAARMRDGTLERIYRRWEIWDDAQAAFFERSRAVEPPAGARPAPLPPAPSSSWAAAVRYFPSLLRAAAVTLVLSCLAMALAVLLGTGIAAGRIYGGRPLAAVLTG